MKPTPKKYKVRNRIAQALREDNRYRPKKEISEKFKDEKYKLTVRKATEEDKE